MNVETYVVLAPGPPATGGSLSVTRRPTAYVPGCENWCVTWLMPLLSEVCAS